MTSSRKRVGEIKKGKKRQKIFSKKQEKKQKQEKKDKSKEIQVLNKSRFHLMNKPWINILPQMGFG